MAKKPKDEKKLSPLEICENLHLLSIDSKNCNVFGSNKRVALVGVEDLVVIIEDNLIVVAKKSHPSAPPPLTTPPLKI